MTKFWKIAWHSSVVGAAAVTFWTLVGSISRPAPQPAETLVHTVLTPREACQWMHFSSRQLGQPAWLAKQQEAARASR